MSVPEMVLKRAPKREECLVCATRIKGLAVAVSFPGFEGFYCERCVQEMSKTLGKDESSS